MSQIYKYLKTEIKFIPAVVCYLKRNDEILLGLRKKVSIGLGENLFSGTGGKVGDLPELENETFEEALEREVFEEINVKLKKYRKAGRIRFIWPNKPKWQHDVFAYVVDEWEGEPQETEDIKPVWFKIHALPAEQMWEDNIIWIPKLLAGEQVNAIFLYNDENKIEEFVFEDN